METTTGNADKLRLCLEMTLAGVADAVVTADAEGRVESLNPAGEQLFGIDARMACGRPLRDSIEFIETETGTALTCPLLQALRSRRPVTYDGVGLRSEGGRMRPVRASATPLQSDDGTLIGGVMVVHERHGNERDAVIRTAFAELDRRVGERRQVLERAASVLRESSTLLETFAASTPELIFAKDREGRIQMVNPAVLRAVGLEREEVIGHDDVVLFGDPASLAKMREDERQIIEHGESITNELHQMTPEGPRIYLVTRSPLRDDGDGIVGIVGVATDITERKRAQRELEHLLVAEHRLRGEAERASRAKDEFLAVVSHELRSPLNALKGWSHVLASATAPDTLLLARATQAIKRNVEHQARLIDDLLDTSRIISGKLDIERRPVNLVEVAQSAIELARDQAQSRRIDLGFVADPAPLLVIGDPGRLRQVVINLLSNAIKFSPEGSRVIIRLDRRDERVTLTVADRGIGIDTEFLPHVFNRFSQADSSTIRRYRGLGIGLALVRSIVELHGGTVAAASPGEGQGATFTVSLPAAATQFSAPTDEAEVRSGPGKPLQGIRILLVDDEEDAREVMSIALSDAGGDITAFGSGQALLASLRTAGPPSGAAVLLLDIAMPDQDGRDLLTGLRAIGGMPFIPAIAVTALTHLDRRQLAEAGFQACVGKPVDIQALIDAIVEIADHRHHFPGT